MNCINEIEEYILNEIELTYGKNIKQYIENLTIEDKHVAMFGAISLKKDGEHKQMIETLRKDTSVILNQIEKIIERFRKYLPVGDVEKKSFGEVFTPFSLVNEMLDTLPVDVWSNPGLKWGDFCNGIGNFMVVVVKRLMIGLTEWEPNENKRYKHIMENMIYVAELQIKNMFLWMVSMDPKSKLKLNLYRGDSLSKEFDQHMKDVWKVEKMDILVSNPPYNDGSGNMGSAHTLWNKFIKKYDSILIENGYLVIVHPSGWRSIGGGFQDIQNLLTSKQIQYLELHNASDGLKMFNAQTTYDWYCLKNAKNFDFITKIKCTDGTIENFNLSKLRFIPDRLFSEYNKIISNNTEDDVNLIHNSSYHTQKKYISKDKTEKNIYPVIYTIAKNSIIKFRWSEINTNGHFGIPKVIWSNGSATEPIIDFNGDYMLTEFAYAIADEPENLKNIQTAMQNKNFVKLMNFGDGEKNVIGHKYNHKIIALLKKDFWKEFI